MSKLICISGVSGAGKSTILNGLKDDSRMNNYCIYDIDDLSNVHEYENNALGFYEDSIKKAVEKSNGKSIILGSCINPLDIERIELPSEINEIKLIAITPSEEEITRRLKERDKSRNCSDDDFIKSQIDYNKWFIKNANLFDYKIDNSKLNEEEVNEMIVNYISSLEMGLK